MELKQLPNIISSLRLLLVPPVVALILAGRYDWALAIFLVAGVSDGVDGFLAKRYGWQTRLGGILDGLADKLLLMGSLTALAWVDRLPIWLVALAVGRDLIIIGGAVAFRYFIGPFHSEPSRVSKLNTVLQIGVAVVGLWPFVSRLLGDTLVAALFVMTAATTVASGAHYVWSWGRRAAGSDPAH